MGGFGNGTAVSTFGDEIAVWVVGSIAGNIATAAVGLFTINAAINIGKSISAHRSSNVAKEMVNKACLLAETANGLQPQPQPQSVADAREFLNLARNFALNAAKCTICQAPSFWSGAWNTVSIIRLSKARSLANEAENHKKDAAKNAAKALIIVWRLPNIPVNGLKGLIGTVDSSNTPEINARQAFLAASTALNRLLPQQQQITDANLNAAGNEAQIRAVPIILN